MRVTPPVLITDAKLTSSSAVEPSAPSAYVAGTTYAFGDVALVAADFTIYESLADANTGNTPKSSPAWWRIIGPTEDAYNAATTYALGATVSSAATHRCYESLVASNVGNPLPVPPETTTTDWLDVGPTNKWAMFDLSRNTQTVFASPLTVVFAPGERVNTVGLTGIVGNSVVISATSVAGGGTVYGPVTIDLNTRQVADGYAYAFEPFSTMSSVVVFDVPPFSDIIITVEISATSGNVKCGSMVVGTFIDLGTTQSRATNDGVNFSTVTRDAWGNATLVPRRTVPKVNALTILESARVSKALDARVALNTVPALWTGSDDDTSDWYEMVQILGIYNQFLIDALIPGDAQVSGSAQITLEIQEI